MTKANTIARASLVTITGKGKAAREAAFVAIAVDSYMADTSRVALVATLNAALGNAPTDEQVEVAKREYVIGRVASRLPAGEFPKGTAQAFDKLEHARKLVCDYQAPTTAKAGKVPSLRKGKLGWRSAVQQRVIRNAEESWSQVKADLGHGAATPDRVKAKAKATRAPQMAGSTAKGNASQAKAATPDHSQLVKAPAPMTTDDVDAYLSQQSRMLADFVKKNAKLLPTSDHGKAVEAFRSAMIAAGNAYQLVKAKREAEAAEKAK